MCLIFQIRAGCRLFLRATKKRKLLTPRPKLERGTPFNVFIPNSASYFFLATSDSLHSNMSYSPRQSLMRERVIIVTLSFCEPAQSTL